MFKVEVEKIEDTIKFKPIYRKHSESAILKLKANISNYFAKNNKDLNNNCIRIVLYKRKSNRNYKKIRVFLFPSPGNNTKYLNLKTGERISAFSKGYNFVQQCWEDNPCKIEGISPPEDFSDEDLIREGENLLKRCEDYVELEE